MYNFCNKFLKFLTILALMACAAAFPVAAEDGLFPVAGIPYGNGTSWGAPGTGTYCDTGKKCDSLNGRRVFSTPYRGPYDGCWGAGCGSHAGTDIAVASGTTVLAPINGRVVAAECRDAPGSGRTGGTVIIKAKNRYSSSGFVWITLAHLRGWDVEVGNTVVTGQPIAESGGSSDDYCHGSSTGSHLHTQVDIVKPDDITQAADAEAGRTFFPAMIGRSGDTPDPDAVLSHYTRDPLPWLTGIGPVWFFAEDGFQELWAAANGSTEAIDSVLHVRAYDNQKVTWFGRSNLFGFASCIEGTCTRQVNIDADVLKRLRLDMAWANCADRYLAFKTAQDAIWRVYRISGWPISGRIIVNFDGLPTWTGTVSDLLFGARACTTSDVALVNSAYFLRGQISD